MTDTTIDEERIIFYCERCGRRHEWIEPKGNKMNLFKRILALMAIGLIIALASAQWSNRAMIKLLHDQAVDLNIRLRKTQASRDVFKDELDRIVHARIGEITNDLNATHITFSNCVDETSATWAVPMFSDNQYSNYAGTNAIRWGECYTLTNGNVITTIGLDPDSNLPVLFGRHTNGTIQVKP